MACDSAPADNSGTAGSVGIGGSASAAGGSNGAGDASTGGSAPVLPALHVDGPLLKDASGNTVVLRGVSLIDIGSLYAYGGNDSSAIRTRIDKVLKVGLQPHVIRIPVYPRTVPNGNYPAYSPAPYPVGPSTAPASSPQATLSEDAYLARILKPTVDYVTQKGMYAIVDYHQIDDTSDKVRTSAADAKTFWTYMADKFKDYTNVIYEAYNEPMDTAENWAALKPRAQIWIDTIRAAAPNNVIIVPSTSWCQNPGDAASSPPIGTNLMYTAHVYPGNWNSNFQAQVATAAALAPVFFTEWGYVLNGTDRNLGASSTTWGSDFRTIVDANGGSWTAWVTDNSWTPNMFSDAVFATLTDFGTFASTWLADKYTSDWVE